MNLLICEKTLVLRIRSTYTAHVRETGLTSERRPMAHSVPMVNPSTVAKHDSW